MNDAAVLEPIARARPGSSDLRRLYDGIAAGMPNGYIRSRLLAGCARSASAPCPRLSIKAAPAPS